jgi:hypothetical protein
MSIGGGKGQFGYTYSENGLAPTIAAGTHGYCIGHILVKKMLKIKVIELNKQPIHQQDLLMHIGGICRCIPAGTHGSTPHLLKILIKDNETQQIKVNSNGSDSNSTNGQHDRPHI